jgi:hypothetical protein
LHEVLEKYAIANSAAAIRFRNYVLARFGRIDALEKTGLDWFVGPPGGKLG